MTSEQRMAGDGKLVTRDGNYRAGRYDVHVRRIREGDPPIATGTFTLAPGAGEHGPSEEFFGIATLVLEGGQETDAEIAGREGDRVTIIGIGPIPPMGRRANP